MTSTTPQFSNAVLWPTFHYCLDLGSNSSENRLKGYSRVNALLADKLLPLIEEDDILWITIIICFPSPRVAKTESTTASASSSIFRSRHRKFFTALPPHERELLEALCDYDCWASRLRMTALRSRIRYQAKHA